MELTRNEEDALILQFSTVHPLMLCAYRGNDSLLE
jgi:hypothetical protein